MATGQEEEDRCGGKESDLASPQVDPQRVTYFPGLPDRWVRRTQAVARGSSWGGTAMTSTAVGIHVRSHVNETSQAVKPGSMTCDTEAPETVPVPSISKFSTTVLLVQASQMLPEHGVHNDSGTLPHIGLAESGYDIRVRGVTRTLCFPERNQRWTVDS